MKRLTVAALAIAMLASCEKETTEPIGSGEVSFSTQSVVSRLDAGGTFWTDTDKIGIQMTSGNYLEYQSTVSGETTTFTPAEGVTGHLYPRTGEVTFNAYYPFQEGTNGSYAEYYETDLTDQSAGIGAHDFMVATATGSEGKAVNFTFTHALAKIYIDVECNGEVTSLDTLAVTIAGLEQIAVYYFTGSLFYTASGQSAAPITAYTVVADGDQTATVEAIINLVAFTDKIITFTLNNKPYTEKLTISPTAGTVYKYTAKIGNEEVKFTSAKPEIEGWDTTTASQELTFD